MKTKLANVFHLRTKHKNLFREPLGPIITTMHPTSLEQAMQFIKEEELIRYSQRSINIFLLNDRKKSKFPTIFQSK